jgi:L-fuculose-phosphate aldolase
MPAIQDVEKRQSIIDACLRMNVTGINQGTSGNISLRHGDGMLITPTSTPYEAMKPEQIVYMHLDGNHDPAQRPSSEWRFHRDILKARPEVQAVVHTHPPYSTMLAIMGMEIPPVHYMVAVAGGDTIRCAPYATFGTQELSNHALAALDGRRACLLANHGMIAIGSSLEAALALAVEVESLAEMYWRALKIGEPQPLPDTEMDIVLEKFRTYGQPRSSDRS